jgi:hypothetical protein
MIKLFRKCLAFALCSFGLLLPWRLRCLYSEMLGWITQFFYLNYVIILRLILNELEKAKAGKVNSR